MEKLTECQTGTSDDIADIIDIFRNKLKNQRLLWSAPIEWSSLNVSAWSVSGLSGRCFRVLVDGIPEHCAV
jgi:hypothetical protein